MDRTVQSTGRPRQPVNHEQDCFFAMERGGLLLAELEKAVGDLQQSFPQSRFVLEDRYGVQVRAVGVKDADLVSECHWRNAPLLMHGREFGRIRYSGEPGDLSESRIASLALILTELDHFALTEGQRRGEKVHKLLKDGMTPDVLRLLSLCGLRESAAYTVIAMELTSPTNKFLYMDILREFMHSRIWAYRATFEFVACRPGGLLAIVPGGNEPEWQQKLEKWLLEWEDYQVRLGMEQTNQVRACVTSLESLNHLDTGVRQVDATLRFAARWNLAGMIRPRVNSPLTYMLAHLAEHKIHELVQRTLGPILVPAHMDLLHTLQIYLFLDQNVAETAKTLYVHRNTLLYRLRHIEHLLGIRLRSTRELSAVWSALEGLELLESSGFDPLRKSGPCL